MKVRKAVIPAAGLGTRFLPATKAVPKEMLAVVDKPLIQYCVEEIAAAGIRDVGIVRSRDKDVLERHFKKDRKLEGILRSKKREGVLAEIRAISGLARFTYIPQAKPLGLGHAVLAAEKFVAGEPFAVLSPDNIYDCDVPCIIQLLNVFRTVRATVLVLGKVGPEETWKSGIVKPRKIGGNIYRILDLIEKPGPERAFSNLAVHQRFVFTPEIFEAIRRTKPDPNGEIQLTDAIGILSRTQPVYGVLCEGKRYDAGDKIGFLEATVELALKRAEFREPLKKILRRQNLRG